MRKKLAIGSVLLIAGAQAMVPGSASAATGDFGNSCVATAPATDSTILMTAKAAANPLPIGSPFTGIITKVRVFLPDIATGTYPARLKVARPTAVAHEFSILASSTSFDTTAGAHTFAVRVPVTAGDLIGLSGIAAYCDTDNADNKAHILNSDTQPGDVDIYVEQPEYAVPIVATVERDADGDGFGDVTQDACPQSAATQAACPRIRLDTFAFPKGAKISVLVATSDATKVAVAGKAMVDGKAVKVKAKPKRVAPGTLGKFTLKLPQALKAALAELPPSRSIKVTVTASATDLAGRTASDKTKVKLPGTG